jgi:hypothetical protein
MYLCLKPSQHIFIDAQSHWLFSWRDEFCISKEIIVQLKLHPVTLQDTLSP